MNAYENSKLKYCFSFSQLQKAMFFKKYHKKTNVIIGDYTYYDDFEDVSNFEKNIKYHFDFIGDKLIIGKFCMIASDVTFIMNGGNHLTEATTAYPFAIFGGAWENAMDGKSYPTKGDTIIGNDLWIGYGATIMPGITIGDGAIIASKSVVTKDIEPYTIVGGNPAKLIKNRFSEETITKLLELQWWNWEIEKITKNLDFLTSNPNEQLIK